MINHMQSHIIKFEYHTIKGDSAGQNTAKNEKEDRK